MIDNELKHRLSGFLDVPSLIGKEEKHVVGRVPRAGQKSNIPKEKCLYETY